MRDPIAIRRLTEADIPFGMMLKQVAGWNQLPADWERLVEFEPDGCFVAQYDGEDAGTATTTAYGQRFGWVGMVLVHPEMRRRGIGTALLLHGIEYLERKGVAAVKLDATPAGKQLYDTIGFVDEYVLERRQGIGVAGGDESVIPLAPDTLEPVCAYDAAAFGADRSRVLRRLSAELGAYAGVALGPGRRIEGYVMVRRGANRNYIGPWVADSAGIGERLWRWALSRIPGEPFFVDVCRANPDADAITSSDLYPTQRQLIRMFRGRNAYPGEPRRVYGIAGPEIG